MIEVYSEDLSELHSWKVSVFTWLNNLPSGALLVYPMMLFLMSKHKIYHDRSLFRTLKKHSYVGSEFKLHLKY